MVRYLILHFIVLALVWVLLMRFRKGNFFPHILVLHSLLLTTMDSKPVVSDRITTAKTITAISEVTKDRDEIQVTAAECNEPTLTNDEGSWGFDRVGYVNGDYGYQIGIPDGLTALHSPCPEPRHGFLVRLSKDRLPRIDVDANYDALNWDSLKDGYDWNVQSLRNKYQSIVISKHFMASLGGLKAIRFVARCKTKDTRKILVEDQIIAFRDDGQIVYQISLTTYPSRYRNDKRVLNEFIRSWDTVPSGVTDYVCNQ